VKDPNELKIKAENAVHELSQVQIHQINKKVNELKSKLRADVVVIVGGLAASIQTAGWSLVASALAAAHGYKTVKEYQSQLRQNPAFFLWKVLKSSR